MRVGVRRRVGGGRAQADGEILAHRVHQVSLNGTAIAGVDGPTAERQYTHIMARWFRTNGAPDNVVAKTIETPAASMYWLTPDDLKAWKVGVTP
jgi:hypothetical protein